MVGRARLVRTLALHGAVGGAVAGLAFALVEMVISAAIGGSLLGPLRIPGAIVAPRVLEAGYPEPQAALLGAVVHLVFSTIYGVIFVYLLNWGALMGIETPLVVLMGLLYGMALWVANFLIIAPILLPQIAGLGPILASFSFSHAVYGLVLGLYVAATRPGAARAPAE